jgi:segregation and condensation protein B
MSEVRNQIEALLFSSGKKMSVDDISALTNMDKRTVKKGLNELKEFYDGLGSSLMVSQEGNLWKLNTRERYVSLVVKIISDTELSMPVLETLAVIAWKSPVLQSDVIKIRSAGAYDHIKELVEASFVQKSKEGRSYKLKITEKFFEYFDVPGEQGIKDAFKAIQIPEEKDQIKQENSNEPLSNDLDKKNQEESKVSKPKVNIESESANSLETKENDKEKLGELDVVPVENNTIEHGKTAVIFGNHSSKDSDFSKDASNESSDSKDEDSENIPPVDEDFLSKINSRIENISKKNDDLDQDELFKKPIREQDLESEGENLESKGDNSEEDLKESSQDETQDSQEDNEKEDNSGKIKENAFS